MQRHDRSFDVCILCALYEEARTLIEEFSIRCGVSFAKEWSSIDHHEYRSATISNRQGKRLSVLVTWLPRSGPVHTAQHFKTLLLEFRPRFAAMTGICAGDQEEVKLGDLVVASAAYHYEEGKVISGPQGEVLHQQETTMAHPSEQVLQYAQGFEGWQTPVMELKHRLLYDSEPSQQHIKVMASGMAVRADRPFPWLRKRYHRNTVALDMETASFYDTLRVFPAIHGLVVKGVCDYADMRKNDRYHDYASRVSAVYLLHFLQEYVTEETMPRHDDSSRSDHTDQPLWTVPFPRHPFFTGQETVLAKLADMLRTNQSTTLTQPQAITGLGGIGKTQIAVEYAWQHRQDYQYVLWSAADSRETLVSGYIDLAEHLSLPEKNEKDQTIIIQAVRRWLGKQTGWLLILDAVEDLTLLEDFLPTVYSGHLLLTTRMQTTRTLAHPLEVEAMSPDIGATLLLRRARLIETNALLDTASPADATIARAISEDLGGLPLALDQAGAYVEETHCGLVAYQKLFRSQPSFLLRRRGDSGRDYPAAVATTWSLSFTKVEQRSLTAADILRCCAFLHPDAIPEELFTRGAMHLGPVLRQIGRDPFAFNEAVSILLSYSLIRRDPSTATLSIHRLMQAVLLDTLSIKVRKQWQDRVIQALGAVFSAHMVDTFAIGTRLLPHALVCVSWIEQGARHTRAAALLLTQTGAHLRERAQYSMAEPLLLRALAICEQELGLEHPDTAWSLNSLANFCRDQGKYEQAEPLYLRALAIREQELGLEHPDTARILNNLGSFYTQQGKYEQAEPLYLRALAIREQELGSEHPDTARSLNNLARLYYEQRKYERAEPLYQRALAIKEQTLGLDPDTARSLNNLARLYYEQEKYEQAEPLYQRALTIREQLLGAEHPDTATSLSHLAILYMQQGKYEQAEPLFVRVLAIQEQSFFAYNHSDLAEVFHHFAILRQTQAHYDEARLLYKHALAARTQILGATHPDTIDTCDRLSALLDSMGRTEETPSLEQNMIKNDKNERNAISSLAPNASPLLERSWRTTQQSLYRFKVFWLSEKTYEPSL